MNWSAGGRVELSANVLIDAVFDAIRELDVSTTRVEGVCIAGELGIAVVDTDGVPITPVICWPDRRAVEEARFIASLLGADVVYELTGRVVDAELPAAKILWMGKHGGWSLLRRGMLVSIKDLLVSQLCGVLVTDEAHASYTMLYDVAKRAWALGVMRDLRIPASFLPPVRSGAEVAGFVRPAVASATGLSSGTPVAVGGPDGTVGAVGAGAIAPGVTVDLAGTTDVILHSTDAPVRDPARRWIINAHVVPTVWTIGGPTGTTGGMVQWLGEVMSDRVPDFAELDREIASAAPGAGGMVCITAMSGERFPTWDASARGSLIGIGLSHTKGGVLRCAIECSAFVVREALESFTEAGLPVTEVRTVGGGSQSSVWLSIRANVTRRPLQPSTRPEATTQGAAMLAGIAAGAYADYGSALSSAWKPSERVYPEESTVAVYEVLYRRYRRLRQSLQTAFECLAEIDG